MSALMKYDEMIKRFRDNGFDFEHHQGTFYGIFPDVTWFEKNDQGIWEKHQKREKSNGESVHPYASEEDMVKEILTHVYTESKWNLDYAAKGHKVADVYLKSYTAAMKVFDKGVFKDVLPESYSKKDSSINSKLVKAVGLAAVGISAILALRKKNRETVRPDPGILIHAERDSISMGDDVMAPNAQDIRLKEDTMVSELMEWVAQYVPAMKNYEWDIWCTNKMIGKLISGEDCVYRNELMINDIAVSELPDRKIFCSIKRK